MQLGAHLVWPFSIATMQCPGKYDHFLLASSAAEEDALLKFLLESLLTVSQNQREHSATDSTHLPASQYDRLSVKTFDTHTGAFTEVTLNTSFTPTGKVKARPLHTKENCVSAGMTGTNASQTKVHSSVQSFSLTGYALLIPFLLPKCSQCLNKVT